MMHTAVRNPLTVITAPAGSGKSVLLRQWSGEHRTSPVASVTFHHGDDAPRIAAQLFAAAARLGAGAGAPIPGGIPESHHALGGAFADALAAWLTPIGPAVLVIEAIDAVREPALTSELGRMLQSIPKDVHVVLTRRSAAPAWLQREQLRGELASIDAADLAFTAAELHGVVRQFAGVDLGAAQVSALMATTEGWAVGVKVAATALRGAADPDEIIDGLRGTERRVDGFLREEVLQRLPVAVRRFLVRTSVLHTLNTPMCRVVAREPAAGVMLRFAAQETGFVRAVDRDGDLFVVHPLLRDVLRQELRAGEPDAEASLLARAAAYQLRRGAPELAAPHLVEAKQWDQLIDLLDLEGLSMHQKGAGRDMVRWLESIPTESDARRGRVGLRRAYALTLVGESQRAARVLADLGGRELTDGEQVAANVLRATWAFTDASPHVVMQATREALAVLDGDKSIVLPNILGATSRASMHALALGSGARALWSMGDIDASRDALTTIVTQYDLYVPWRMHALSLLALGEAWTGDFRAAQRPARQATALATSAGLLGHTGMIDTYLATAHMARERGHLVRAGAFLTKAHDIAVAAGRPASVATATVERAQWYLASGEPELGLAEVRAYDGNGELPDLPLVQARLRAVEMQLLVSHGDTDRAEAVLAGMETPLGPDVAAASVQTALARHDIAEARARLDRWPSGDMTARGRLQRGLWQALVEFAEGQRRLALDHASRVVVDAQAQGCLRLFLDVGRPADRLLRSLGQVTPTRYVSHLLRAAVSTAAVEGRAPLGLSQREQEVVLYLPTPLSSAEIAAQLYISLNTLKTHLRTIYRKLGVSDRRDAIQRAQDMGLA